MPGPMTNAPKKKRAAAKTAAAVRAPKPKSNLNTGRRSLGSPTIKREAGHRAKTKAQRAGRGGGPDLGKFVGEVASNIGKVVNNRPTLNPNYPKKPFEWPAPYKKQK